MEDPSRYRLALWMHVDRIRSILIGDGSGVRALLEVVWHRLGIEANGVRQPDDRPGAKGHAGIEGLGDNTGLSPGQRLLLRKRLCEIATATSIDV